jgi:hypothetical protein
MLNLKIRFPEEFRYTVRMFPVSRLFPGRMIPLRMPVKTRKQGSRHTPSGIPV